MSVKAGGEDHERGLPRQGPVRPVVVVVGAEGVELELELGERPRGRLAGQEALEGLVKAFDLAAGLGVVGGGVLGEDAEALQLGLEEHQVEALDQRTLRPPP